MKKLFTYTAIILSIVVPALAVAAPTFQVDTNTTLTTALVSYYKLDADGSDVWGANNLVIGSSTPSTATGIINTGMQFGGGKFWRLGKCISTSTSNFSASWWSSNSSTAGYGAMWENGDRTGSGGNSGYDFGLSNGGSNFGGVGGGAGNSATLLNEGVAWVHFGTIATTTAYHHYILENATGTYTLYQDLLAIGTSASAPQAASACGIWDFRIGLGDDGVQAPTASTTIDEFGFWNKALSTQERTDLYNGGSGDTMVTSSVAVAIPTHILRGSGRTRNYKGR